VKQNEESFRTVTPSLILLPVVLPTSEVKCEDSQVLHPLDLSGITTHMAWVNVIRDENNVIDRFRCRELCHAIILVITFKSILDFFGMSVDTIVNMAS
jgi:hypothetical protein